MKQLLLFSTSGCHLCELAKEVIWPLLDEFSLHLNECEIADSDALIEAYGVRIPVIKLVGSEQDLGWPFDAEQARAYLAQVGVNP